MSDGGKREREAYLHDLQHLYVVALRGPLLLCDRQQGGERLKNYRMRATSLELLLWRGVEDYPCFIPLRRSPLLVSRRGWRSHHLREKGGGERKGKP